MEDRNKMTTQNTTLNTIKNLIDKGLISDSDLASFANYKLAKHDLALADSPNVTKRKKRPVKANANSKAKASTKDNKVRAVAVRTEATDGRTNKHALLYAINALDECKSKDLKAKLIDIGHPMGTAVFHTQLSTLQSKSGAVKSRGALRHNLYSLNVAGKKLLSALNEKHAEKFPPTVDTVDASE